ncbi:ORF935 [White spot syndrome virus]|uniref:ORF935 n=1 Tax=White spot syndrome virus TaxID=342409 RepID=A0A2D3I760_9VIRU|nr:ORF935 [White spot syndrome virus]
MAVGELSGERRFSRPQVIRGTNRVWESFLDQILDRRVGAQQSSRIVNVTGRFLSRDGRYRS